MFLPLQLVSTEGTFNTRERKKEAKEEEKEERLDRKPKQKTERRERTKLYFFCNPTERNICQTHRRNKYMV